MPNKKTWIKKTCKQCKDCFEVTPCRRSIAKFCSLICAGQYRKKNEYDTYIEVRKCKFCGKEFKVKPYKKKSFCSFVCNGYAHPMMDKMTMEQRKEGTKKLIKHNKENNCGKNHWNWKGGLSRNKHNGGEYAEWRTCVFERDDYTCQLCGSKGVYLNAHHKKSWAKYPKLRFKVSNGITLCTKCHAKIDKNYAMFLRKGEI